METIELWPFSQGEIADAPDRFVDAAFADGPRLGHDSSMRRRDYIERAAIGGFPEAVRRTDRRRAAFFESYLDTLIKRDVQEISAIERTPQLRKLLQLLAVRSANLVVPTTIASGLDIHRSTITRYLALLETVFLIKTIPAWSGGTHRAIGTPKLAFVDTGVLCHLLGQGPARLADPGGAAGPVLENFVLMELARQLTWSEERATHGLRHLESRLGDRFVAGFVLYTGQHSLPFGDRMRALPIDILWRAAPQRPTTT